MHSKKIMFSFLLLMIIFLSNQNMTESMALANKTKDLKDEIYNSITLSVVNATIYDDRSTYGDGYIYFTISIENATYVSTITPVSTSPGNPASYTVNWTINQNVSVNTKFIEVQVRDAGNGTFNSPDYLGNFNITNLGVGTIQQGYNTSFAKGGSADPQASLFVKTVITQHQAIVPPVITVQSATNLTMVAGSTHNYLNFSIFDDNPNYYTLEKDNALLYSGGWNNNANITFNIDGLGIGVYNYTITAYDSYFAQSTAVIWINVTSMSGSGNGSNSGNGSTSTDGRTNRTIGASFAGPEYILLGLAIGVILIKKRKKMS